MQMTGSTVHLVSARATSVCGLKLLATSVCSLKLLATSVCGLKLLATSVCGLTGSKCISLVHLLVSAYGH